MSDVMVKVIPRRGICQTHKVGDELVMGERAPARFLNGLFHSPLPFAQVLPYGGSFPREQDPKKTTNACPDAENAVMFELRCTSP